jgi:hypothetical protein
MNRPEQVRARISNVNETLARLRAERARARESGGTQARYAPEDPHRWRGPGRGAARRRPGASKSRRVDANAEVLRRLARCQPDRRLRNRLGRCHGMSSDAQRKPRAPPRLPAAGHCRNQRSADIGDGVSKTQEAGMRPRNSSYGPPVGGTRRPRVFLTRTNKTVRRRWRTVISSYQEATTGGKKRRCAPFMPDAFRA